MPQSIQADENSEDEADERPEMESQVLAAHGTDVLACCAAYMAGEMINPLRENVRANPGRAMTMPSNAPVEGVTRSDTSELVSNPGSTLASLGWGTEIASVSR